MDLEAVVFDIDGTLYPNGRMYLNSLSLGIRIPFLLMHFSRVRSEIRSIRPIADFRKLQAELLARRMHISPERAFDLIDRWIYGTWEDSLNRIRPFPYVKDVLQGFRNAGYRLGVVSDFPVRKKLEYLDLGISWDCALTSEETGYLKPNPEPFLEAARRLGTSPERILYVGNSYSYDICGANRVGMHTAHLSDRKVPDSCADLTFADFRELLDVILAGVCR